MSIVFGTDRPRWHVTQSTVAPACVRPGSCGSIDVLIVSTIRIIARAFWVQVSSFSIGASASVGSLPVRNFSIITRRDGMRSAWRCSIVRQSRRPEYAIARTTAH